LYPKLEHLKFNAFSNLIYGAKGLLWYNYGLVPAPTCPVGSAAINAYRDTTWNPARNKVRKVGKQKEACESYIAAAATDKTIYMRLRQVNLEVKNMGPYLMRSNWVATVHGSAMDPESREPDLPVITGQTPYLTTDVKPEAHITVGLLKDTLNPRTGYLAVFNKDIKDKRHVELSMKGCPRISIANKQTGDLTGSRNLSGFSTACKGGHAEIRFNLDPGDMALVVLNY
jgi:hypothetical protein